MMILKTATRAAATLLFMSLSTSAFGASVVMIGDSITCGPFGDRMLKNLEQGGKNSVTVYCMVGSAPSHWLNGKRASGGCQIRTSKAPKITACSTPAPTFDSILKKHPQSHLVIALGTNSTVGSTIDGSYRKMAAATKAAGRSCDWILPPHMNPTQSRGWAPGHVKKMEANLPGIIRQIDSAVSTQPQTSCSPIDSRAATASGTPGIGTTDGVHRTKAAGNYWADEINGKLLRALPGNEAPARASSPARAGS